MQLRYVTPLPAELRNKEGAEVHGVIMIVRHGRTRGDSVCHRRLHELSAQLVVFGPVSGHEVKLSLHLFPRVPRYGAKRIVPLDVHRLKRVAVY